MIRNHLSLTWCTEHAASLPDRGRQGKSLLTAVCQKYQYCAHTPYRTEARGRRAAPVSAFRPLRRDPQRCGKASSAPGCHAVPGIRRANGNRAPRSGRASPAPAGARRSPGQALRSHENATMGGGVKWSPGVFRHRRLEASAVSQVRRPAGDGLVAWGVPKKRTGRGEKSAARPSKVRGASDLCQTALAKEGKAAESEQSDRGRLRHRHRSAKATAATEPAVQHLGEGKVAGPTSTLK